MTESTSNNTSPNQTSASASRRTFLKDAGTAAAATALVSSMVPRVHAQGSDTVQIELVGGGGRGTGAASNALAVKSAPLKLVAMADVFDNRLKISHQSLKNANGESVEVPDNRKFIGFDAYKEAIDTLKKGDIAIFATPPAFRWVHLKYAIEKGVNVFMEKPITVDGPSTRKMFELGELATKKNIKVGVGLMCRHCKARGELFDRIQGGEIGDVIALRCYRMHPPVGSAFSDKKPEGMNELMYQIQRFHSFLWASGGLFSDFYIHNIDECCWMKNGWPVKAQANGGRHYRGEKIDQNFDTYSVEYTFGDGAKMFLSGRTMPGCHDEFASYVHGSNGIAVISQSGHSPARRKIYKGQNMAKENLLWSFPQPEPNPYQLEWEDLVDAVRNDKPYNEVKRGAEASLVTSMGRMAAHTGQVVTYDDILNSEHEFAPGVDKLALDGEAPIKADKDGKYPVPMPGITTSREYA
jgi:predicted dehydrogenase